MLYILVALNSRHVEGLGILSAMAMFGFELFFKYADVEEAIYLEDSVRLYD